MKHQSLINLFDNKYRWLIFFGITFAGCFYWLPEQIPLYYSQALMEERLASKYALLILPLFVFIFFVVSETFLTRLALNNRHMLNLIRFFRIGLSIFSYLLFIRIIFLII